MARDPPSHESMKAGPKPREYGGAESLVSWLAAFRSGRCGVMRWKLCRVGACLIGLASCGLLLVACGGGGSTTKVQVNESEWQITPDVTQVKQGKVTFNVTNKGTESHEFLVVQSDLPVDGLPFADNQVNEDAIKKVVDGDPFDAGKTVSFTANLAPGKYILICNIREQPPGQPQINHYQKGMRTAFTVTS
jgi:uncharacterized cupredoxin-like copper-binding protein